jgi:N6-adenosine-specific RNA methylase IME4
MSSILSRVIYADPPWTFKTYSSKGRGRCADAHYDVMSLEDLKGVRSEIDKYAAKNCALFLWATDPLLPKAIDIIEAWGFNYKTVAFYWAKLNKRASNKNFTVESFFTGLGYWTRANAEICLLATRGTPKRLSRSVKRLVIAPRREHSRKPDQIYERIEALMEGPYLELFARSTRAGWRSLGNQIDLFDYGAVETRRWPSVRKIAAGLAVSPCSSAPGTPNTTTRSCSRSIWSAG